MHVCECRNIKASFLQLIWRKCVTKNAHLVTLAHLTPIHLISLELSYIFCFSAKKLRAYSAWYHFCLVCTGECDRNVKQKIGFTMDIASLIGFLGAIGMILRRDDFRRWHFAPFIDVPSILIVFGGTFLRSCIPRHLPVFLGSFGVMAKAFLPPVKKMDELVERMSDLASIARKDGMMALEGQDVPDKFFQKGLQMLVDGADEAKLVSQLNQEIKAMKLRHEANQGVIKGWIDIGPAMGMIGTLIGLVLMLGNMADPKAIGPAMAVALVDNHVRRDYRQYYFYANAGET